jgi:hypothetical protein
MTLSCPSVTSSSKQQEPAEVWERTAQDWAKHNFDTGFEMKIREVHGVLSYVMMENNHICLGWY